MRYSYHLFIIFLGLWIVTGCSTSVPLSEAYIFNKDEVITNNYYPKKDSLRWESSKGGGISFSGNAEGIKNYLIDNYEAEEYGNLNKVGVAYSAATNVDFFSLGYNIGYNVLGVNATFGLGWNNYITLNGTLSGGEAILQHKVFESTSSRSHGGIALGIFAKRNYYTYNKGPKTWFEAFIDIHGIRDFALIDVYGGRAMFHQRFYDDAMLHGFVSYGYSPKIKGGILSAGFVLGFDNFK